MQEDKKANTQTLDIYDALGAKSLASILDFLVIYGKWA